MNMQASGSASGIRRKNFYTWSNLNLVARASGNKDFGAKYSSKVFPAKYF